MAEVHILAASNAADRGLRALADLAAAAHGNNYRIIGGHMVHILGQVYPTTEQVARVTADADAGMDAVVAASSGLHSALVQRGYRRVKGNHYEASSGSDKPLAVDLLVPSTSGRRWEMIEYDGRGFDAIPGLQLALLSDPVDVRVHAHLTTAETLVFDVPVPDVEAAVVLKALAWRSRLAAKDVGDLCSLMTIVFEHRDGLAGWKLDTARKGSRGDAARALYDLVAMIDRHQQVEGLTMVPARLAAMIRRYVADPATPPAPSPSGRSGASIRAGRQVPQSTEGPDGLLAALRAASTAHPRPVSSMLGDSTANADRGTGGEVSGPERNHDRELDR